MKAGENIILEALLLGGCIRTFYRVAIWQAERQLERIPELYVLERPGGSEDQLLSKTDFQEVAHLLIETEVWEEVSGGLCSGGATLLLRAEVVPDVESSVTALCREAR
ncbi:TPA: cytoplasmic protein [Cronobacter sakazakii]|nr:cytoplasmic protein [Cronobacter sakazakii]